MSVCKICLCSDPKNDVSQIKSDAGLCGEYILLFCLGIQVIQGSGKNTKLCERCFAKLAEFHQFKSLALQNEATLSSLGLQKYIENDIKSEILSLASDDNDYDEPLIDVADLQEGRHINLEIDKIPFFEVPIKEDLKQDLSDNEPLSNKKNIPKIGSGNKGKSSNCTPAAPAPCKVCGKQLTTNYKLRAHLETHKPKEKQKIFKCTHCNKIFKNRSTFLIHLDTHKPIEDRKTFECAHCNQMFTRKNGLIIHITKIHPEEMSVAVKLSKMFPCELCTKIYHEKKKLQVHLNAAHAGSKAQCPICYKRFAETYLQNHIRTRHQTDSLPYKCECCDRKFVSKSLLNRHVTVHSGDKPYSCDLCDAKFRLKYSVRLHKQEVHEKAKNHICHICSKRYFSGSLLQRHLRNHSKQGNDEPSNRPETIKREIDKKVTCPDCGKPMASKRTLKHHRLLHKGLENHCELCGLTFATRKYVLNHMKTHEQIRKFYCKFCNAAFVRSGARRTHELNVHIMAGEKKPPKKDTRKKRIRKKKLKQVEQAPKQVEQALNVPIVNVSVPVTRQSQFGQGLCMFPISGPFKTEDDNKMLPYV